MGPVELPVARCVQQRRHVRPLVQVSERDRDGDRNRNRNKRDPSQPCLCDPLINAGKLHKYLLCFLDGRQKSECLVLLRMLGSLTNVFQLLSKWAELSLVCTWIDVGKPPIYFVFSKGDITQPCLYFDRCREASQVFCFSKGDRTQPCMII